MPAAPGTFMEIFGYLVTCLAKAFADIFKGRIHLSQLRKELIFIGYECLPMIVVLTGLASMIMTLNTAVELSSRGGRELVGALIATAVLREILPIFIAFAIAARCGTAITAEISTMKITEQVDALRVMKISPIYYLLSPKVLAVILLSPLLVAIATLVCLGSGMMVAKFAIGLEFDPFLESAWKAIGLKEYFYPLIKTVVFSIYAILVNTAMGLACEGGAKEVGLMTTKATAISMVGIVILDGILTPILYL